MKCSQNSCYAPFSTRNEALKYLAGFFDGEGCLTISKQTREGKYKSPEYKIRVIISNTNLHILDTYKTIFGGEIYSIKRYNKVYKDAYQWTASNKVAYEFCKAIKDHLIIKKKNAELLMEMYDKKISNKYPIREEELNRRENLLQQIRVLNKRGIA